MPVRERCSTVAFGVGAVNTEPNGTDGAAAAATAAADDDAAAGNDDDDGQNADSVSAAP